jgi:hypothetical protein
LIWIDRVITKVMTILEGIISNPFFLIVLNGTYIPIAASLMMVLKWYESIKHMDDKEKDDEIIPLIRKCNSGSATQNAAQ